MSDSILIDYVAPTLSKTSGGTASALASQLSALNLLSGIECRLFTDLQDVGDEIEIKWASRRNHIRVNSSPFSVFIGAQKNTILGEEVSRRMPMVTHSHGIWHPLNHLAVKIADSQKIPLVIQPHGALDPWALRWKRVKKEVALFAYQKRDLEVANLLVAASELEYNNIRKFGLRQPVAVIPNFFELAPRFESVQPTSSLHSRPRALYLGRIHPVKGLKNLLLAWKSVARKDWLLQIAGPDDGGYLKEVLNLIENLDIAKSVEYLGEVDGDKKWSLMRASNLFILPSLSENFGISVAEALSVGLPVITTTATPWRDLPLYNAGWCVKSDVDGLKDAIDTALSLTPEYLKELGKNGLAYVRRFSSDTNAKQLKNVYLWLLNRAPLPTCVRF